MNETSGTKNTAEQILRLQRIQTILIACMLVLILVLGIFLAVKFSSVNRCIDLIEQRVQAIDMSSINSAVDSFTKAADRLTTVDISELNDAVASLKEAADTIGGVDTKVLNDAVASLKDAANNLSAVDVDSLNSLVQALENVAARLESAVKAITGIFGG